MAQFKVIPPEIGTDNASPWCLRFQWRLQEAQACTPTAQPRGGQPVQTTWDELLFQSVRELPQLLLSLPTQAFSVRLALFANQVAKAPLEFPFLFLKEEKTGRVPQIKELCYSTNALPLPSPLSPHLLDSVEHYWSGVLVCRLGHMTEDIFLCYNAKEASIVSDKALPETQLSEDVYHNLHWGVVCDCERTHIKDASQF